MPQAKSARSKVAAKPAPKSAAKAMPKVAKEAAPLPRRALGRGLSSLIPPPAAITTTGTGYRTLPIERLKPNKKQPRKIFDETALAELTHSISIQGVLQPILVRKMGDDYEIVAGERRWRAASRAGLREVPTVIKDLSDSHALQIALIENIQRADLDPLEEAEAYHRLTEEHKLTHEELAEAVGKNRTTITNSLRLLKMPKEVLQLLIEGKLTASHVRPLMPLSDEKLMIRLAEDFAGRAVSVLQAKEKVAQVINGLKKSGRSKGSIARTEKSGGEGARHIAEQLQRYLNTKVGLKTIDGRVGRGQIVIDYHTFDALDGILDKIMTR